MTEAAAVHQPPPWLHMRLASVKCMKVMQQVIAVVEAGHTAGATVGRGLDADGACLFPIR
jgi:hypothetical protein